MLAPRSEPRKLDNSQSPTADSGDSYYKRSTTKTRRQSAAADKSRDDETRRQAVLPQRRPCVCPDLARGRRESPYEVHHSDLHRRRLTMTIRTGRGLVQRSGQSVSPRVDPSRARSKTDRLKDYTFSSTDVTYGASGNLSVRSRERERERERMHPWNEKLTLSAAAACCTTARRRPDECLSLHLLQIYHEPPPRLVISGSRTDPGANHRRRIRERRLYFVASSRPPPPFPYPFAVFFSPLPPC